MLLFLFDLKEVIWKGNKFLRKYSEIVDSGFVCVLLEFKFDFSNVVPPNILLAFELLAFSGIDCCCCFHCWFRFFLTGYFPLGSEHCLTWICLDVLFCTASIMHLCTISVDRYLSLRYPMRFGRNKTRRRVTLKIVFVWLLSIAMSLPLSLMYSKVSCFDDGNTWRTYLIFGSCHCLKLSDD